jgi:hypothetical protein
LFERNRLAKIPHAGKALRDKDFAEAAAGFSTVEEIRWRKRRYYDGKGKWLVGYVIVAKLARESNGEKEIGRVGVEIWNDGANVQVDTTPVE